MDKAATSDLHGLIMMGGKSRRMGFDKSVIPYHGKPQCQYLFELISELLPGTYVSARQEQPVSFTQQVITDRLTAKGPVNGLLSAHVAFPDKAWLVLAIDLPFISPQTIQQLIQHRASNKLATALMTRENGWPEPLAAIWEPEALEVLYRHHLKGEEIYPRNFLQTHEVQILPVLADIELFNVNNPADFDRAKAVMDQLK